MPTTIEAPAHTEVAPAKGLTAQECDALLTLAASTERVARVRTRPLRGAAPARQVQSRAWSLGGRID